MPSAYFALGNAMEIFTKKLSAGNPYAAAFLVVIILIIMIAISILWDPRPKRKNK